MFLFCISGRTMAQNVLSGTSNEKVSFEVLASKIENTHHIRLFYTPEWFVGKTYDPEIANLPIARCLQRIKWLSNLNCLALDSVSYVFVPNDNSYFKTAQLASGDVNQEPNEFVKFSRAKVTGRVFDGKTGEPLPGVIISLEKQNYSATTNKSGVFETMLPVGEYAVKLSYMGYEDATQVINVKGNEKYDFELYKSYVKIDEVTISAQKTDVNIRSTQMGMVKLNSKNLKELPVFLGERDIIKSVTLLPGVQSTGEFGTGFFVRGGGSDQNLILIEDVPLFNSSHVFGLNSAINPDGVLGVTLYKAGIPAKYGERASSVMDIKMRNTAEELSVKGGIGLLNSRLNLETPLLKKNVNLLVGGRSSYSNWLLHEMPDIDLKNSSAGFFDLNGLLTVKLNAKNRLTFFGYYSDDQFRFNKNSNYHYSNTLASVRYNHIFNNKLSTNLLLGTSQYAYSLNETDSIKPEEDYQIDSSISYHNAKWNFLWAPNDFHSVNIGVNAILYQLQPGILAPYGEVSKIELKKMQQEKGVESSAYVSDNLTFSPKFSAELGLRYTRYARLGAGTVFLFRENETRSAQSVTDTLSFRNNEIMEWYSGLEPRISIRYILNDMSSLKLSYSRNNQFINLISNTTVMSPTDVYRLSNPNQKPLICTQYALGYFLNFAKNKYEFSVETYYKSMDNVLEYKNGAQILLNDLLDADLLNAKGQNYGFEFYLQKNSGRLTGWASYTYSKSLRYTSGIVPQDQINENRMYSSTYDKPNNLILLGNYHISRRWRFSGTFNYNSGRPVTLPELKYQFDNKQLIYYSDRNKYRLPDYHRLDISITFDETLRLKQKWKSSWTLSILNVYGRQNLYSAFYKTTAPTESKLYRQSFSMYKMFILNQPLPTLTYNFSF